MELLAATAKFVGTPLITLIIIMKLIDLATRN